MAATEPRFGIRHLTVVPTNFEPADESADTTVEGSVDSIPDDVE